MLPLLLSFAGKCQRHLQMQNSRVTGCFWRSTMATSRHRQHSVRPFSPTQATHSQRPIDCMTPVPLGKHVICCVLTLVAGRRRCVSHVWG